MPNSATDQWANMEPEQIFIDLKSPEYTEKFKEKGEVWQQSKTVDAVHVTENGLNSGDYEELGVHWGEATFKDGDGNDEPYEGWLIDTYVMKGEGDSRRSVFETTRRLKPGEWIVTNPPYSIYDKFMDHCFESAINVCVLVPFSKVASSMKRVKNYKEKGFGIKKIWFVSAGRCGFPFGYPCGFVWFQRGCKDNWEIL